jgi:hypothetical protein
MIEGAKGIEIGDFIEVRVRGEPNPFSGAPAESTTTSGRVIDLDGSAVELATDPSGRSTRRIALSGILEWTQDSPPAPNVGTLDPERRPVIVRLYPGRTQTDAASLYAEEAIYLALHGYLPIAQSWATGEPGVGRVLALGMLGAVALRPKGALTVTYVHRSVTRDPRT